MPMSELEKAFQKYTFYHEIEIEPGVFTPGWPVIRYLTGKISEKLNAFDLRGKRVLDVGCRDGLFCLQAEKQGASEILGIDNDLSVAATEFILPKLKSRVQMTCLNLYDLRPNLHGTFDFVIFVGVLYHLRYPFLALDRIADVMKDGGEILIETAIWITSEELPLLYCPKPGDSPYEPTSVTFYNNAGMIDSLEAAGFADIECLAILQDETNAKNKIGRGIYRAKKTEAVDKGLKDYWFGTHSLNSSDIDNNSFLTDWNRGPPKSFIED